MRELEAQRLVTVVASEDSEVERLRRQNADLAAAVVARDTFIAVAAHELRNPMQPIIGQIEILLSAIRAGRCPPDQVERRLERVEHAMCHYIKRAGVLLDVSRINSGKLQFEFEAIDVMALLHEVAADAADAARRASSPITVTGPDTLPVTWDRLAIEQIMDNLVANAIKYAGSSPIELSAEARGEDVRVQVRDHGGGIPAADRARVFERFERAVGRGERRSGFGVGLWVVRQLAEAMGGTVAVGDAPGGGALFTVTLPRHAQQASL